MKKNLDLPEQIRSLSRFPIPVAIATSLAVLLNLQVADVIHMSDSLEIQLFFACSGAFLASFAAHLWAISRNLSTSANLGTALVAAGAAAVIQHFRGDLYSQNMIALFGLVWPRWSPHTFAAPPKSRRSGVSISNWASPLQWR
jgi:hypothetical protein